MLLVKNFKRLMCVLLAVLMLVGCANQTKDENYDEILIEKATEYTNEEWGGFFSDNPFINSGRVYEVTLDGDIYNININGTERQVQFVKQNEFAFTLGDIEKYDSRLISKSKELIINYINSSNILEDKEGLIEFIKDLPVNVANFTEDEAVGAWFDGKSGCVYINRQNVDFVCQWMIVHELVHAIAYYTHGHSMDYEYVFGTFNEVLTDIITWSMQPDLSAGIASGYMYYYEFIFPLVALFQEQLISSYFYGYDEIREQVSKIEFDFMINLFLTDFAPEDSVVHYNNLVIKWQAVLAQ